MTQVWKWTPKKEKVALEIFLGELNQAEIAEKLHISRNSVRVMVANKAFKARLEELRKEFLDRLMEADTPFLTKEQRIRALATKAASASKEYEDHKWRKEYRADPNGPPLLNKFFNREAYDAFRAALDDIAKELGERKARDESRIDVHVTHDYRSRLTARLTKLAESRRNSGSDSES